MQLIKHKLDTDLKVAERARNEQHQKHTMRFNNRFINYKLGDKQLLMVHQKVVNIARESTIEYPSKAMQTIRMQSVGEIWAHSNTS